MIKKILVLLIILTLSIIGFSQDKNGTTDKIKSNIPEKVSISLDGLLKTRTSNNIYELKYLDSYFYVLQKSVYVNVLFTADLSEKIKELEEKLKTEFDEKKAKYNNYVADMEKKTTEENKKIEGKNEKIRDSEKKLPLKTFKKPAPPVYKERDSYHNLYLRVVQDGKILQKFKSPIPCERKSEIDYFSFGLIIEPGKYDLLINVDAYDNSIDGTLLIELEVPALTLTDIARPGKSLEYSRPVFYKNVNTLPEADKRFTVVKNCYRIGVMKQKFSPFTGKENNFKSGTAPILTFFIKGSTMVQVNPPWDITGVISIKKGKKKISSFKPVKLQNPFFFQPVSLIASGDKPLTPGEYSLNIELSDNNGKGVKGKVNIPFKIIE